ncbi:uncharacterized protein LOC132619260 isoform X2 [Lycium barbarum]|uniref:uncharacterized protein LOC132619260 isoform X2 n=1 Tax=Lycium barbarum TaxID=112863 RepID=UPI00293F70DF|nr:uncharacterized protein LOC132619260 isoform X2 [Lycium barbarum]
MESSNICPPCFTHSLPSTGCSNSLIKMAGMSAQGQGTSILRKRVPGIYRTWTECESMVKGFSGTITSRTGRMRKPLKLTTII